MDAHALLVDRMADNSIERYFRMAGAKCECNFRADRKGVGIEDKNAFHAYVTNGRGPFIVKNAITRLGLESLNRSSVFVSHNLGLAFSSNEPEHFSNTGRLDWIVTSVVLYGARRDLTHFLKFNPKKTPKCT